jgi:hypothetical protein
LRVQLIPGATAPSLRARLRAAACVLLAAGAPVVARAEAASPAWQLDLTGLAYAEKARTSIYEPVARITRLFADGQSFSAQVAVDAMTGASPSGAQPSGSVVTTTSASGVVSTHAANEVPTKPFHDLRGATDLDWVRPIGWFTLSTGGHWSRERDYESYGLHGTGSLDVDRHLSTFTFGGGVNRDRVFPVGGIPLGIDSSGTTLSPSANKRVTEVMGGVSRVLTRRWMLGVNASRVHESGYLTEPYKIVSVLDAGGVPTSAVTENRPDRRDRTDVLGSSVYHLERDVLYTSYRYYWDDWGVKSHTIDLKYRTDMPARDWLQPHLRWYKQSAADFFRFGLQPGEPTPRYATSDFRLGPLQSVTVGLTYGTPVPNGPGEITLRGEYLRQWGDGHPANALGVQRSLDLFPSLDTFTIVAGWSVQF